MDPKMSRDLRNTLDALSGEVDSLQPELTNRVLSPPPLRYEASLIRNLFRDWLGVHQGGDGQFPVGRHEPVAP